MDGALHKALIVTLCPAGCERCGCDPVGTYNQTCDVATGQCLCKPGVAGRICDHCMEYYYGFSEEGCQRESVVVVVLLTPCHVLTLSDLVYLLSSGQTQCCQINLFMFSPLIMYVY